jgi:hypothetical protein
MKNSTKSNIVAIIGLSLALMSIIGGVYVVKHNINEWKKPIIQR